MKPTVIAWLFAATLLADPITSAFAAESYLCVADKGAGFSFEKNTKTWNPAKIKVAGKKYIMRKVGKDWTWTDFGETPDGLEVCENINQAGLINCHGLVDVHMNSSNLRYLLIYDIGYVYDGKDQEGSNTPYMEIGSCSPL